MSWVSYVHKTIELIINCNASRQCDDRLNRDLSNLQQVLCYSVQTKFKGKIIL